MKNKLFIFIALFFAIASSAQTVTSTPDSTATATITPATPAFVGTVVVNAESLKGITIETLRPELVFPALGIYKATGASTTDVIISLDEVNKGIVWVNGLPQGKFKAVMKKSPSTYKIPAQKTEKGNAVAEGTLFLNPQSKELTIVSGRSFNDADPTSFLSANNETKSKKKMKKTWRYTGIKADAAATVVPQSSNQ